MRWANALDVKNQTEKLFLEIWGEKPKPAPKGKNKEVKKEEKKVVTKVVSLRGGYRKKGDGRWER